MIREAPQVDSGGVPRPYGPTIEEPENPPVMSGMDYAMDVLKGVGRGVEGTGKSIYNLMDTLTFDALPDAPEESIFGKSRSFAGSVAESITQFATAFVPVAGWVGKGAQAVGLASKLGKAAGVVEGAIAGGITDFIAYQGGEERLSNLIESVPALRNPITSYLAADGDDDELFGRFKNTIEGLGLGVATDLVAAGVRSLKNMRAAAKAGLSEEEIKAAGMSVIGDPEKVAAQVREWDKHAEEILNNASTVERKANALANIADGLVQYSVEDLTSGNINVSAIFGQEWNKLTPTDLKDLIVDIEGKIKAKIDKKDFTGVIKGYGEAGANMADFIERYSDNPEALKAFITGTVTDIQSASIRGKAVEILMAGQYKHTLDMIRRANESGMASDLHAAMVEMRKAQFFHSGNSAIAKAQSHGFMARKFTEVEGTEAPEELLRKIKKELGVAGGSNLLKKEFARLSMATDPAALSKLASMSAPESIGGRLFRIHNEFFINSILSGIKTQTVNFAGNIANTFFLPAEGFAGAFLNADFDSMKAYGKHFLHLAQSATDAVKFSLKAFLQGQPILNRTGKAEEFLTKQRSISPEFISGGMKTAKDGFLWNAVDGLGVAVNLPTRTLMATDEFFKQLNYRAAARTSLYRQGILQKLKGKELSDYVESKFGQLVRESGMRFSEHSILQEGIKEAERQGIGEGIRRTAFLEKYVRENYDTHASHLKELSAFSDQFANEVSFTADLRDGSIPLAVQQLVNNHPTFQLIIPFVRTPTNILKFFGQRIAPVVGDGKLPVLSSIHKRAAEDMLSGDPLRIAAVKGRLASGAAMSLTFAELASQGLITGGGPSDPDEKKVLMETGWQPYSMKVGNEWVSYQRLDPFASFMSVVADMSYIASRNDAQHAETLDLFGAMLTVSMLENLANKSYLSGLGDVFNLIADPERYSPRLIRKQLGSYVPAAVAGFKVSLGDEDSVREVRSYMDAFLNRIPVLSKTLEAKRNILGEKVALRHAPADWINPLVQSTMKDDAVMGELAALEHGFKNPSNLLYRRFDLTQLKNDSGQTAYDRLQELSGEVKVKGKTLRQALGKLITSRDYKKLPANTDPEYAEFARFRVGSVNRVINLYRAKAQEKLLREFPQLRKSVAEFKKEEKRARQGRLTGLSSIVEPQSSTSGSPLASLVPQ